MDTVMSRAGRKRKMGRRKRSGDLVLPPRASPLEVAQAMPHRKALGALACDQRAENELGRMVLRGELDEILGTAGDLYRGEWKAYIASLSAPRALTVGGGKARYCDGCLVPLGTDFCLCEKRKRRWMETMTVLADTGCTGAVDGVCLHDYPSLSIHSRWLLRLGLEALARHYGLMGKKVVVGNVAVKPPA